PTLRSSDLGVRLTEQAEPDGGDAAVDRLKAGLARRRQVTADRADPVRLQDAGQVLAVTVTGNDLGLETPLDTVGELPFDHPADLTLVGQVPAVHPRPMANGQHRSVD